VTVAHPEVSAHSSKNLKLLELSMRPFYTG
jgi:hypothetical protein